MKIRSVHIDNYRIFRDFDIDFTHNDKAQNLIVLAGINGCGKTTLMKSILFDSLESKSIANGLTISLEFSNRQDPQFIEEFNAYNRLLNNNNEEFFQTSFFFYESGKTDFRSTENIILQYVDKLIYQQDKKSSEAYKEVQKILNLLFDGFDIQIEFSGVDKDRIVWFKNQYSENIRINELSSGEQELINKAFSLYLDDVKDSIIFIDEPEGSMHPSWQSRIAPIYQKIADERNNQIFLATHSPQIVSSVKKEQVRVLIKEEGKVRAIQDFEGSYGWRVDKVLLEIFGVPGLRTPDVEQKLQDLRILVYTNRYDTPEFKAAFTELEKLLGYGDTDLSLLRLEILKRKKQSEKDQ